MISCLSGRHRFSPGLPWLCCINPVRVSTQLSTPFLSLESNPWRKSEPQHPAHPCHLTVQTASWLRSAGQLWFLTEFSLLCLARTCCCAPLWGSVSPSCPCPWGSFQYIETFLPSQLPPQGVRLSLYFLTAFSLLLYMEFSLPVWKSDVFCQLSAGVL